MYSFNFDEKLYNNVSDPNLLDGPEIILIPPLTSKVRIP
ncbi:hypothetical protein TOT_030000655 [Theileria orientalis strain Shintoku]|uniref:Uncharacterized protein n=1 Tax=Theileria orientalis strain Shintoku TaxID=869250 RepID=J4C8U4_THEOR|nr:hypothetical protein TOT_030000655 [Theileria orientalis strain Shintoku]BAM41393.1 hypothetical protein TOT_030000655 [Theileria orientalis strain Shintoku]|eukprot:XP_009691694.1 hypothetical protein TOT_030000655 [Theileria orientalis strain Shintoku]